MSKVLIYGDAGQPTGFEKITRGLAHNLSALGHEVVIAGIGYFGQRDVEPYDVPIIPASRNPAQDFLGIRYIRDVMEYANPDIVIFIEDVWNAVNLAARLPLNFPKILYTLPDSPNIKWIYGFSLGLYSHVVVPTYFAQRELAASVQAALRELSQTTKISGQVLTLKQDSIEINSALDRIARFQNMPNIDVVPLGLSDLPHGFREFSFPEIPRDKFVVLNINTNSFRKRLDLTLLSFRNLLRTTPNSHLVIHAVGDNSNGWELQQLRSLMGIPKNSCTFSNKRLSPESLVDLMCLSDVMINTSTGEGWGLPAVEGWQLSIPQLVPDWSATRELWGPYSRIHTTPHQFSLNNVNTLHGRIDPVDAGEKLRRLASHPEQEELYTQFHYGTEWTWMKVAERFNELISSALAEDYIPENMTYEDIIRERLNSVLSEAESHLDSF